MAITIEEKKIKIKEKRSQAVMSKINLLRTRDGSEHPPIESLIDVDTFNRQILFGLSGNETINWTHIGIEGLIRAYYNIVYFIDGTIRNNIVKDVSYSGTRSGLSRAADYLLDGKGYISGFFKGWIAGQDGHTSDAPDSLKNEGIKGVFDETSSSFTHNRDLIGTEYPENNTNNILENITSALTIIGNASSLHPGGITYESEKVFYDLITNGAVSDTICGRRHTDIVPYSFVSGGGMGPDQYTYGNGSYDYNDYIDNNGDGIFDNVGSVNAPDGYDPNIQCNYYNPSLDPILENIITLLQQTVTYIEYTKVDDETYFSNLNPIYGRTQNPKWNTQNVWIDNLNGYITSIDNFLTLINTYYVEENKTSPAQRANINTALNNLVTNLNNLDSYVSSITSTIDTDSFFGTVSNPNTMRGYRFLLIKSILNSQDGSKTAIKGIETALVHMNNSLSAAEDEFGIFGISQQSVPWTTNNVWVGGLKTPNVVGIQTYSTVDTDIESETFGEMISVGYIIAWDGIDHATNYDLWKSSDWDGDSGTWIKILPAGNDFTIEEMDNNTGKIVTYYIDTNVDPDSGEKPYYKVKAYDSGGSGDYYRIPADSEQCEPKFIDDFDGEGGGTVPYIGPTLPVPAPPGSMPDYLFRYVTKKLGSEANDISRTIFESTVEFDSIGSNLEVFIDGILKHKNEDYSLLNGKEIQLTSPVGSTSEVTMIVYFGGGDSGNGAWKNPVNTKDQLPTTGNTDGDVRMVLDEGTIYTWEASSSFWKTVKTGIAEELLSHDNLSDMPDIYGTNTDHDERYYTETEVDSMVDTLNGQINALQYLIPDDAAPLAGNLEADISFVNGYLSPGVGQNFDQLHAYENYDKLINNGTFVLTNPNNNTQFNKADQGFLRLYVNDNLIDQFNLETAFNESERNSGQTYPPQYGSGNKIEIIEVVPYMNYGLNQKGDFRIHISSSDLRQGENNIKVIHILDTEQHETTELVLFYDTSTNNIIFTNIQNDQYTILSSKYLSGVRHLYIGDSIQFEFTINHSFDNTYTLPDQISVDCSDFGITPYTINPTSSGVLGAPIISIGQSYSYSKIKIINLSNVYKVTPYLKLTGNTPFGSDPQINSSLMNILINTYNNYSDDKNEYFVDEQYRLSIDDYDSVLAIYKDLWNSTSLLGTQDLQVFNSQLVYPTLDYSSNYIPNQTVNYAGFSGNRSYIRAFIDLGIAHNNGTFYLKGFNISHTNTKISIKLPSQTGWLDLKTLYNEADFTGTDNDGCLINENGEYLTWTSGQYSTAYSGYMVLVKITFTNPSYNPINQINIDW